MTLIDYAEVRKRMMDDPEVPDGLRVEASVFGVTGKMRVDRNKRLIWGVISASVRDVDNEVVLAKGIDFTLFPTLWKAVYLNHDKNKPIGACRHIAVKGEEVVAQTFMTRTALGEDTLILIEDGVIDGQSVGFFVEEASAPTIEEVRKYGDADRVIRKWPIREYSVTPMQACPGATGLFAVADGKMARLDEMVTKGLVHRSSAVAAGLPDSPTRRSFPASGPARTGEDPVRTPATVLILG
jgi:hypothetical protein